MGKRSAIEPSECRSCKALILWTTTEPGGKAMPIDVTPTDEGSFIVNHRKGENKLIAVHVRNVAEDALLGGRRRYVSHFSTCPNAAEHRRGK